MSLDLIEETAVAHTTSLIASSYRLGLKYWLATAEKEW